MSKRAADGVEGGIGQPPTDRAVRPRTVATALSADGVAGGGGAAAAAAATAAPADADAAAALLDALYGGADAAAVATDAGSSAARAPTVAAAAAAGPVLEVEAAAAAAAAGAAAAALDALYALEGEAQAGPPTPAAAAAKQLPAGSLRHEGQRTSAAGLVDAQPQPQPPPQQQQQQQQQRQQRQKQKQRPPRPKQPPRLPPPAPPYGAPTIIRGPTLPEGLEALWNGVVLVDKPKGWTSFDVCAKLKGALRRAVGAEKLGHAGTLDPLATGLLIVCTGYGTKGIEGFMGMEKEYTGTLRLGEGTPSQDAEEAVTERLPWEHITDEQLAAAAAAMTGDIQQVPPMYSAVHHQGQRLYELARQGEKVDRPPRDIHVTSFQVWRDAPGAQDAHFRVVCSKGTYVRTLAYDLAASLGTVAHLTALRREAIGTHRVDGAWDVLELAAQLSAAAGPEEP